MVMASPNRWLHLRNPDGFSEAEWTLFQAHCRVWVDLVKSLLANWTALGHSYEPPHYEFFEPELSPDRTVATLPIGGGWTVGSRATIENGLSYVLWWYMPIGLQLKLEEGLTEPVLVDPTKLTTNWRKALKTLDAK